MVIAKISFALDMRAVVCEGNICDQRVAVSRSNHYSVTFKPGLSETTGLILTHPGLIFKAYVSG